MSLIRVSKETKRKLLEYAGELQKRLGRRIDLDDTIRSLLLERTKNPQLLIEACVEREEKRL